MLMWYYFLVRKKDLIKWQGRIGKTGAAIMARKYSVQNYMRRTADDLSISGAAVIVLGAWSFLKLFVTAVLEGALITPELLESGMPPIVIRLIVGFFVVIISMIGISLHLYIGLSARSEARGKRIPVFYLFITGLFLFLTLLSCIITFWRFFRTSESDASTALLLVDLTLCFALGSIIVSSHRLRALRHKTEEAEQRG